MNNRNLGQTSMEDITSNIIFGTSSDDIQQGLHSSSIKTGVVSEGGDKDQIVNEEEQNEIINPSEPYNEEPLPKQVSDDNVAVNEVQTQLEQNPSDSNPQEAPIEPEETEIAED